MQLDRSVSKAVPAVARNRELAEILVTRHSQTAERFGLTTSGLGFDESPATSTPGAQLSAPSADFVVPPAEQNPQRKRKVDRMQAVRQSESGGAPDVSFQSYMVHLLWLLFDSFFSSPPFLFGFSGFGYGTILFRSRILA